MSFDVFISYARRDRAEALELTERLQSDGMTVWIDRRGIGGAKQWAAEIASAIRDSETMLVLLSENAMESSNVLKEVTLAAERHKPILPVILRRAPLPVALEYHLAGIHYLPYADYSSICAALKGTAVPVPYAVLARDKRKSVLVLPLEDLSPGHDNGWFADGLTSELITMLSKIKSLRVIDRNTSMEFKQSRGRSKDIARDLSVRYFLEGVVRKFGDQIKISIHLLDVQSGNYLWHDEHTGVFSNIFEIQENVTKKVVEGLELTLSQEEENQISDHGTSNADAYERYLQALNYFFEWSKEGMKKILSLTPSIISLDPKFAKAYRLEAYALLHLYRLWERKVSYLERADTLFEKVDSIRPELIPPHDKIVLYLLQKRNKEAEEVALKCVKDAPFEFLSYFYLAYFYFNTGRPESAIPEYEMALHLNRETAHPDYRLTYWNLTEALDWLGRTEDRQRYAFLARPHFERWLAQNPGNQFARAQLATLELYGGEKEKALETISSLRSASNVDGLALYTTSVLFMHLTDEETAMSTLERAVAAGFSHLELLEGDPNFTPVRETPRFQAALAEMRKAAGAAASAP